MRFVGSKICALDDDDEVDVCRSLRRGCDTIDIFPSSKFARNKDVNFHHFALSVHLSLCDANIVVRLIGRESIRGL